MNGTSSLGKLDSSHSIPTPPEPPPRWDNASLLGSAANNCTSLGGRTCQDAASTLSSTWQTYQTWVESNPTRMWLLDELLSRLLLWTPSSASSSSSSSKWRPIGYGLLDLHRLLVEVALTTRHAKRDDESLTARYSAGTSVALQESDQQGQQHNAFFSLLAAKLPNRSIRLALTVLQGLLPISLELIRALTTTNTTHHSSSSQTVSTATVQPRQATVRRFVERLRFVLRLSLLFDYWRCFVRRYHETMAMAKHAHFHTVARLPVLPGLLLHGGRYHAPVGIPIEHEQSRLQRSRYVGRRTGRRSTVATTVNAQHNSGLTVSTRQANSGELREQSAAVTNTGFMSKVLRLALGELLYILRPMVQAEYEPSAVSSLPSSSWRKDAGLRLWVVCLVMDLTSIISLRSTTTKSSTSSTRSSRSNGTISLLTRALGRLWSVHDDNPVTARELQRRQGRLLLYLLRSPTWQRHTEPTLRAWTTDGILSRIPVLGSLVNNYIWDWIYYWQIYRMEEG